MNDGMHDRYDAELALEAFLSCQWCIYYLHTISFGAAFLRPYHHVDSSAIAVSRVWNTQGYNSTCLNWYRMDTLDKEVRIASE